MRSRPRATWRSRWSISSTRLGDPNLQMLGNWAMGAALFHLGELQASQTHLTRALEMYDPAFHGPRVWETGIEPGVFSRCELSRILLLRGYPDQCLAMMSEAVAQARALEHPQPLAFALMFLCIAHLGRRESRVGARHLRRARPDLPRPRHRAGAAMGRSAARPRARRARRRRSRPARDGRVARRPHPDAIGPAASVLLCALRRRADPRPALPGCLAGARRSAGCD